MTDMLCASHRQVLGSAREVLEFRFRSVEFPRHGELGSRVPLAGGTLVPEQCRRGISVAAIREGVMGTQLVLRTCASFRRMLVQLL